jgi:hypothetical protein
LKELSVSNGGTFPTVDGHDVFHVAWMEFNSEVQLHPEVALASVDSVGERQWVARVTHGLGGGQLPSVASLSNGNAYLAFSRRTPHDTTSFVSSPTPSTNLRSSLDAFARLYDAEGRPVGGRCRSRTPILESAAACEEDSDCDGPPQHFCVSDYPHSIPREGDQRWVSVGAHRGDFAGIAYGSTRRSHDSATLDFIKLDPHGSPVDADPPILDNASLLRREIVPNQRVIVAGGNGPDVAILYNSEEHERLAVGRRAKLLLLQGGPTPCPVGVDCGTLLPFRTTGSAGARVNVALKPSRYPMGQDGEREFLRELRETLLVELAFGGRHHREHYEKFNFLAYFSDADIGTGWPSSQFDDCPAVLDSNFSEEYWEFQESYPWIYSVGAILRAEVYGRKNEDWEADGRNGGPGPSQQWCASTAPLASGGLGFMAPAPDTWIYLRASGDPYDNPVTGTFEHEFAHGIYRVPDEYANGCYLQDTVPVPSPSQHLTLAECEADAANEGWDPADCHIGGTDCGGSEEWYIAELRPPTFRAAENDEARQLCLDWLAEHPLIEAQCLVDSGSPTQTTYRLDPTLDDLMGDWDSIEGTASDRTVDMSKDTPTFQRACERNVLVVLDDPRLAP